MIPTLTPTRPAVTLAQPLVLITVAVFPGGLVRVTEQRGDVPRAVWRLRRDEAGAMVEAILERELFK